MLGVDVEMVGKLFRKQAEEYRLGARITQAELAHMLEASPAHLSKVLNGVRMPGADLILIAIIKGVLSGSDVAVFCNDQHYVAFWRHMRAYTRLLTLSKVIGMDAKGRGLVARLVKQEPTGNIESGDFTSPDFTD